MDAARERGPGVGEVQGCYVHPDHWGSGAAQALLESGVRRLRADGFEQLVLWTLPGAARARRFYERNGWVATGRSAMHPVVGDHECEVVEYATES